MERYTSNLPVQKEFIRNVDSVGDMQFVQIKREGDVCIYKRSREDGNIFGYEVITLKQVKAGTPLPGGNTVEEDYESYPGKSDFGKNSWFCTSLDRAEEYFHKAVNKQNGVVEETSYEIPNQEFTVSEFGILNKVINKTSCYLVIQKLIDNQKVKELRRESKGRGLPTVIYAKN